MASYEFRLPDIGEGVTEGEIVEWHVRPGDTVREDQPMVEVTTDKATVTIGAPISGKVRELRVEVGKMAQVGDVLVVFDAASTEASASAIPPERTKSNAPAASAVGDIQESLPGSAYFAKSNGNGAHGRLSKPAPAEGYFAARPLATPATRKLARELSLDIRQVRPSGEGGRVTKDDVLSHAQFPADGDSSSAKTPTLPSNAGVVRKPFVGIRRRIAEKMQTSVRTAAHFTFVEECAADRLVEVRASLAPIAEARGVKLTLLPFFVKAVVGALKRHPILNSTLDEARNELVYREAIHLGIATSTEQGLVVPVLRDADSRSLLDVAREIERLASGARAGRLNPSELSGSTFTITSLGKSGGLLATPILNHPEVGILGVHRIRERPVVRDGQIVVGQVMLLSLSFDHRIVDGHVGAAFAYDIIEQLEEPNRLMLE